MIHRLPIPPVIDPDHVFEFHVGELLEGSNVRSVSIEPCTDEELDEGIGAFRLVIDADGFLPQQLANP